MFFFTHALAGIKEKKEYYNTIDMFHNGLQIRIVLHIVQECKNKEPHKTHKPFLHYL